MTGPTHEELQDLIERFGFEEKEAEAFYHLNKARDLFDELSVGDERRFAKLLFFEMDAGTLFRQLRRHLAVRVLRRNYPEGWGYIPPEDTEKKE